MDKGLDLFGRVFWVRVLSVFLILRCFVVYIFLERGFGVMLFKGWFVGFFFFDGWVVLVFSRV